jgi:hypothetical protein
MKNSKQIKSFILKKGNKLTNSEMATKLGVPTMTFAGVLAHMKRKGEVPSDFLKTDLLKTQKTTASKTTVSNPKLTVNFSKVAVIKKSELTSQLRNRLADQNKTLISGKTFYNGNAFDKVIENHDSYSRGLTEKSLSRIEGLGRVFAECDYIEII